MPACAQSKQTQVEPGRVTEHQELYGAEGAGYPVPAVAVGDLGSAWRRGSRQPVEELAELAILMNFHASGFLKAGSRREALLCFCTTALFCLLC